MQLLDRRPGGTLPQGRAVPCAVRKGAAGGLALAGQLGKILDRDIDVADLVPCAPPDDAIGSQVELFLKRLDRGGHFGAEHAVGRQPTEEGVILGDPVELPLERKHGTAGGTLPERRAGIALGDGLDVVGADDLDVAAVVVLQDLQCVFALFGQRDGAPLLQPRAGDRFAVAVFRVIGVDGAGLADVGVEDVVGQPGHDLKHRPSVDVILVVAGGVGDVEPVSLAGVPLGVDAVQSQRDLAVDVGAESLFGPCGVDFAGCDIGDVVPERDGDVLGGGGGSAEVDGDGFGDDDPVEDAGAGLGRCRAAAAFAGKEGMGRDDHRLVGGIPVVLGCRDHLGLRQRDLPRKDLDALNAHSPVAGLGGGQGTDGVGLGGIVLIEREGAGGGGDGVVAGVAGGVGDAVGSEAVARQGDGHPFHRGGLAGGERLNAEDSGCHGKISFIKNGIRVSLFRRQTECAKTACAQHAHKICVSVFHTFL